MQQHVGAAGRIRARVAADDRIEAEGRFERGVLEPAVEQVARAAREELEHRALRRQRQRTEGMTHAERGAEVAPATQVRRRRLQQQRAQQVDRLADVRVIGGQSRGVAGAARGDGASGVGRGGAERETAARCFHQPVLQRALEDREAVFGQTQILLDPGMQQADGVARRRVAEAGMEFLGDGGASGHAAALVERDVQAGGGEVRGAGEAVVAGPDDRDVRIRPCGG